MPRRLFPILILGFLATPLAAQRPLDLAAFDRWRTIEQETLTRNGQWVAYVLQPDRGDGELVVRATGGATEYRVPRGRNPEFSPDGGWVVFMIAPQLDSVEAAKRAKKRGDDLPKDSLGIMTLATGEVVRVAHAKSFRAPEKAGGYFAYLLERPRAARGKRDTTEAPSDTTGPKPKPDAEVGSPLVLRQFASGAEHRYDDVTEYVFSRDGARLAFVVSSKTGETDGVTVVALSGDPADRQIASGRGTYKGLSFADAGDQLAFVTTKDEADREHPRFALYTWKSGGAAARGGGPPPPPPRLVCQMGGR
jgi:hypothetical protein